MKSVIIKFIIPLGMVCTGIFGWPGIKQKISEAFPSSEVYFATFSSLAIVAAYYYGIFKPHLTVERNEEYRKKWHSVEALAQYIIDKFPEYKFSMNVMKPQKVFYSKIEPNPKNPNKKLTKWFWRAKEFKIVWSYNGTVSNEFKMTTNQGFAGEAYKLGPNVVEFPMGAVTTTFLSQYNHNFHPDQQKHLNDLCLVASIAIKSSVEGSDKPVGVFNIESRQLTSLNICKDQEGTIKDATNWESFAQLAKLMAHSSKNKLD